MNNSTLEIIDALNEKVWLLINIIIIGVGILAALIVKIASKFQIINKR